MSQWALLEGLVQQRDTKFHKPFSRYQIARANGVQNLVVTENENENENSQDRGVRMRVRMRVRLGC
jgi:hypothetical protein